MRIRFNQQARVLQLLPSAARLLMSGMLVLPAFIHATTAAAAKAPAVVSPAATPNSAAPDAAAQAALKRFADGVLSFHAHFEQVQTDDRGQVTNRSSGEFWLQRPGSAGGAGRFRWEYQKPYAQLTVCDGEKLWAFDPDLNQVTVRMARDALAGSPAELLSQRAVLTGAFTIEDAGTEGELHLVKLIPKSKDSDFKHIELAIDKSGAPMRMRFADQIGGTSQITFSDTATNGKIDAERFSFTPPKGTEIVNGDGPVTRSLQ